MFAAAFGCHLRRFCVGVSFLLLARAASGQALQSKWSVHVWQSNDGLPSDNVRGIVQTKDGYLWVGTDAGLARFDGVRFTAFSPPAFCGGTSSSVSELIRSHAGGLVLAMHMGPIARLSIGAPAEVFAAGLPDSFPSCMEEDGEGNIWIDYHSGIILRLKNGVVTNFSAPPGSGSEKTDCTFADDSNGRLWRSQGSMISIYRNGGFETIARMPGNATRVGASRNGKMWVCTANSLYRCDDSGKFEDHGSFKTLDSTIDATVVLEDHTGAVWIGTTYNGLFRYDGKGFENIPTSHERISCLTEDTEGNLWVGTAGRGINRVQPRAVVLEGAETGLPPDSVQSICEDGSGTIWAATRDGRLKFRKDGGWNDFSATPAWPGGAATCITTDHSGVLWIGTRNSEFHRLQNNTFTTFRAADGLTGRIVSILHITRSGDVWIVTQQPDKLQRMHDGNIQTIATLGNPGHFRGLVEDSKGDMWIGSDNGLLFHAHGNEWVDETSKIASAVKNIRALYVAPDDSLWIAAGHSGIARLKGGRLSMLSVDQGLYDNTLCQIIPDDHGWLWIGASRGIFKVRQQQLDDVADGLAKRVQSVHYGEDEDLPNLEATSAPGAAPFRSGDGHLWMVMGTALAIISPENLRDQMQPPPVFLERVMVDDIVIGSYGSVIPVSNELDPRKIALASGIVPGHHRLQFDFTALSFDAPTNVRFQYRLDGVDDQWIDAAAQRSATYPRLPAGDYRFQVRACNSDGVWNDIGATLGFTVVPFMWQTWWFRLVMLAAFTASVVIAARYVSFRRLRMRLHILEQQTALHKERARIARDLHDDLGARLTKIVMLSDLTLRDYNGSGPPERVQQISSTARQVMKSLDETVWAVNPRNDTLPNLIDYIGQFATEFLRSAEIRCRVDLLEDSIERPVSAEVRHNVLLTVKEALNNVVRHAHASEVWLRIKCLPSAICLSIEDDGQGFDRVVEDAFADGLRNMRQRMEEINGRFEMKSESGTGTRISIIFPWNSQN
jgi:ligand-binding sensor domain-containing protein/signal transduction histidine kinase